MHEHIIQVLSQPHSVTKHTTIRMDGRPLELTGYSCAHWAALCFVTRLASDNVGILSRLQGFNAEALERIKTRRDPMTVCAGVVAVVGYASVRSADCRWRVIQSGLTAGATCRAVEVQKRLATLLATKYPTAPARVFTGSPSRNASPTSLRNPLFVPGADERPDSIRENSDDTTTQDGDSEPIQITVPKKASLLGTFLRSNSAERIAAESGAVDVQPRSKSSSPARSLWGLRQGSCTLDDDPAAVKRSVMSMSSAPDSPTKPTHKITAEHFIEAVRYSEPTRWLRRVRVRQTRSACTVESA